MVIKHSFVCKRNTNDLKFGVEVKLVIYLLVHPDLICPDCWYKTAAQGWLVLK